MASATDRKLVVGVFDQAVYPSGKATLDEAWLGIYQTLLWYEHGLLHIREAMKTKLKPRSKPAVKAVKDEVVRMRIPAEQKAALVAVAEREGLDLSVWLRSTAR